MKKRLRKKLYRGEFKELAFPLRFSLDPALDQGALDSFFDRFILTGLEANNLSFSGAGGHTWDGVVARLERGTTTEVDRDAIATWLEAQPEVRELSTGEFKDAWYGDW